MIIKHGSCKLMEIIDAHGLDSITVFWQDFSPGCGEITVVCYGRAWTAYFGAMSGKTIKEFVDMAGIDYLVNKMDTFDMRKKDLPYLTRIITAVKKAIEEAANGDGREVGHPHEERADGCVLCGMAIPPERYIYCQSCWDKRVFEAKMEAAK